MALALETVAEGLGNTLDGDPTLINGAVALGGLALLWSLFPPLALLGTAYLVYSVGKAAA